jgi:Skp family chaperone for outer membrane proteins
MLPRRSPSSFAISFSIVAWSAYLVGCAGHASSAAAPGAAFVDMRRAVMECREGREARAALMSTFRASQKTLDDDQARLYAAITQLRAARDRGEETRDREEALRKDAADLKAKYLMLQQQLTDDEIRRADPIQARLRALLPKLAATRRVGPIAEAPPAPGSASAVDLTNDLIREADAPMAP